VQIGYFPICAKQWYTIVDPSSFMSVGLGIRFFLKLRFGFSVLKNFGFLGIRNRSVFLKMKNREVRFRFFTSVFR
jgi:hypothetical protein